MTGEEAKIPLRCYVYATRGAPQTFGKFRDRAACEPGWKLVELEGGHFIHLDQYAQVRDLLLRLGGMTGDTPCS
ncbi:MAG: hypothetical protein H6978_04195 [Gammaproteobacteria bacterium]|nr:hypothetical protein [Gammaproteobacteria bacterium]